MLINEPADIKDVKKLNVSLQKCFQILITAANKTKKTVFLIITGKLYKELSRCLQNYLELEWK